MMNCNKARGIHYEYSVEKRWASNGGFISQIDVFDSLEKAEALAEEEQKKITDDKEIVILTIEYDEDDNEIGYYSA